MQNKISERLNKLMEEEHISAYKLSKDIGVSQSVIGYWRKGKTTPNADYIIKLAEYFEVCTDYLLGRQDYY